MKKPITKNKWFWVVIVVVALAALGNILGLYEDEKAPADNPVVQAPSEDPVKDDSSKNKSKNEVDMSLYKDIPMTDDFKATLEEIGLNAKQYFLDKHNVDWINEAIENVFVTGSENSDSIEVLIQIYKSHELLNGQIWTFRNTAVDMVQEAGLTKMNDNMRKVKVRILWTDTATEIYTFTYGVGWDKD